MHRHAIAMLLAGTPAFADGTATWLWNVTTQDGDAIVEPGETARITLSLLMQPGDGPFIAFATAVFNTLGTTNADKGTIVDWDFPERHLTLVGDTTTTNGVSLFETTVGQLTVGGPITSANPIDILTFEWAPSIYEPLDVAYETDSWQPEPHTITVWEGESKPTAINVVYPVTEAAVVFTVIPAPPTILLFTIFTLPRRRSSPPSSSQ